MATRTNADMGFVDAMLTDLGGPRSAALLRRLDQATPWATLAKPILRLPEYANRGAGNSAWDPTSCSNA